MIESTHIHPSVADQLRPVARQWVGQTFFGTMLKQARESSFAEDSPLSGGRGGQAFGSLLDQHLSEGAAGGAGDRLVESLVRRLAPENRVDVDA